MDIEIYIFVRDITNFKSPNKIEEFINKSGSSYNDIFKYILKYADDADPEYEEYLKRAFNMKYDNNIILNMNFIVFLESQIASGISKWSSYYYALILYIKDRDENGYKLRNDNLNRAIELGNSWAKNVMYFYN